MIEGLLVDLFLKAHPSPPKQIILDLDATDDRLHGHQEGRFFHGYYDCYCYLPLYVFCGRHLLATKLRRADIDASAGAVEEIARIVARNPRQLAKRAHPAAGRFRLRPLATPEPIKDWSLTSLKEKLIKIGAKVVSHGRYVAFQMAEGAIPRNLFADILRLIAELRPPPVTSTA